MMLKRPSMLSLGTQKQENWWGLAGDMKGISGFEELGIWLNEREE